jgi:hypothetical protein
MGLIGLSPDVIRPTALALNIIVAAIGAANYRFNYSTSGFSAPEDMHVAVCVLPGTELSFTKEVKRACIAMAVEQKYHTSQDRNFSSGQS